MDFSAYTPATKINVLKELSEAELIELYRKNDNRFLHSKIFKTLLYEKQSGGKSWHQNILTHVGRSSYRINLYESDDLENSDLYQEIMKKFLEIVTFRFDIKSKFGFATYAWHVINSAVDRKFQSMRTKKRNIRSGGHKIEINHQFSENKKIADVISDRDYGLYRTLEKSHGFERIFFYKSLLNNIYNMLEPEKIVENESLINELTKMIRGKSTRYELLQNLAIKYDRTIEQIYNLKQKLTSNIEKQMYLDIIKFIEHDVKDDSIIASKYKCSRGQITKMKEKLAEMCRRHLKSMNMTVNDCF